MRTALLFFACTIASVASAQNSADLTFVNSPLDEQGPVLSPDGKTLFFTISHNPQCVGGAKDFGDIWYSTMTETGWTLPVHAGSLVNNPQHNTVVGLSQDGNQLFLMGHYEQDGRAVRSQGISVSTRTATGWSAPKNIVIPYFKNLMAFGSGHLSDDGNTLVFSAESYGTLGVEDIYVATKQNGNWTEPVNLGPDVNTSQEDLCPSMSADGRRLYFSTNGRGGYGSFDVFYSDRLDDTWKKWSAPVNMGEDVNSKGRDLFYRTFSSCALYTTAKSSDEFSDMRYRVTVEEDSAVAVVASQPAEIPQPVDSSGIKEVTYKVEEPAKVVGTPLKGMVTNARTGQPLQNVTLHFLSHDQQMLEAVSTQSGQYATTLPGLKEYHIRVEAPGYIGEFEKLDLRTQVMTELEMNFQLHPVEVGTTVNLRSVLFEQSKPVLLIESYDELDMVSDFMKQNPHVEIELAGHTDNRGRHDQNMKLSRERVYKVKEYLVNKGIDERRITGKGYGGTKPIADNDAEDTRALNRRVEFTIVKD